MPVDPYAHWQALMQRTAEAVTVPKRSVAIGDWQPQENQCHLNATTYCEHETDCQPVRGWLYFSAWSMFVAHSVVRGPDGSLFDITPWVATAHYPFLTDELSEEDFADLVEVQGYGRLTVG